MARTPQEDLKRADAREVTAKGKGHSADYSLVFDGSFQALQRQTEYQYRCVDSFQAKEGRHMGVEVLDSG